MSDKHTLGGIRRPYSSALQARLLKRLTRHPAAPMNADRNRMFDMIKERILSVEPKSAYDKKSIPIKSFSVTTDGIVGGKKKWNSVFGYRLMKVIVYTLV